jgi:hypothetical protein
MYGHMFQ